MGRKLESAMARRTSTLGVSGNLEDTTGHPPDVGKGILEVWESGTPMANDA